MDNIIRKKIGNCFKGNSDEIDHHAFHQLMNQLSKDYDITDMKILYDILRIYCNFIWDVEEDAKQNKMLIICQILIEEYHFDIHFNHECILIWACKNNFFILTKYLLESGANVSDTHENIILAAIQSDNLDIVKLCVECGADTTDERILSRVVCMNNIKMLEFFLNIGIQITPMTFINAIHSNFLSMTKLLIQYGADVNCYNSEPIMVAIHNRYVETVELLLENGAIINTEIPTSNSDNAKLCSILRNYNIDDAIIIKLLIADE